MRNQIKQRFGIVPAAIWESDAPLDAKIIYSILAIFSDRDGYCWPSRKRLAGMAGRSLAWVSDVIKSAENAGFLRVERTNESVNRYYLKVEFQGGQPAEGGCQPAEGGGSVYLTLTIPMNKTK